jgi:hypothetical protein
LALRNVREEHERLAAVVHGMRHLARAMLLHISEYPERLHHAKAGWRMRRRGMNSAGRRNWRIPCGR